MPRFCANLSLLFTEYPFCERFAAAARAGFTAVEIQFPYELAPARLADLLKTNGLALELINFPAGDWAAGERGIACLPGRRETFRAGVRRALSYARATGCRKINCLAGIQPPGLSRQRALDCMADNLAFAAALLEPEGIMVLVEAINTRDLPGFVLHHSVQVIELLQRVGAPNLALQYDVYHMQVMEGDLLATLERLRPWIGHIQVADHPGRHEPGSGEIDFLSLFSQLDRMGYTGRVGLEYNPRATTEASLGWMAHRPPTRFRNSF